MTFDEACQAARRQLEERGQLLNSHLLRLVDQDEALCQEVRESLIFDGLAVDRFGVGLAPSEKLLKAAARSATKPSRVPSLPKLVEDQVARECEPVTVPATVTATAPVIPDGWWWMADGVIRGPENRATIQSLLRSGEIHDNDVVRQGTRGVWQRPGEIPELVESADDMEQRSKRDAERSRASQSQGLRSKTDKSPDEPEFYMWESGRSVGPLTRADLQLRLDAGRIEAGEFVRAGLEGEWQPVSTVLGDNSETKPSEPPPVKAVEDPRVDPLPVSKPSQASRPTSPVVAVTTVTQGNTSVVQGNPRQKVSKATKPPAAPKASAEVSKSVKSSRPQTSYEMAVATDETRAVLQQARGVLSVGWERAARLVGGQGRLRGIICAFVLTLGVVYWLRMPPSGSYVYGEFMKCHQELKELRDRPGSGPESQQAVAKSRAKIRYLVTQLKDSRTGASSFQPAKQHLLWAGDGALLKLLETSNLDSTTAEKLDSKFERHMRDARTLLDGKTIDPLKP